MQVYVQKILRQHFRFLQSVPIGKIKRIKVAYDTPQRNINNYKNTYESTKVFICSSDSNAKLFEIVAKLLQEDTLA